MSRLATAFAKGRPASACLIAAGDTAIASNPDAPANASPAKVW